MASDVGRIAEVLEEHPDWHADAADLAYLLAENARLRAQLDTVRELHRPERRWMIPGDDERSYDTPEEAADCVDEVIDLATLPYFDVCAECKRVEESPCEGDCTAELGYEACIWPCRTAAALNQGGETK